MSPLELADALRTTPGEVRPGYVLVVDDDAEARNTMMRALGSGALRCVGAANPEMAMAQVMADPNAVDAIILALSLSETDWVAILRALKASTATAHIPVILVTSAATRDCDIVSGVELGASDIITNRFSSAVLSAKVRSVRARAQVERRLRHELRSASLEAMSDPLTGLFNRRHFEARVHEASARAKRNRRPFSIALLDLDHFKSVNDTHGHIDGDRVLVHFANTIQVLMRADDIAFRYGGDEFVLLLSACDANRAVDVAHRLRDGLCNSPLRFSDGSDHVISFSAGVAAAEEHEYSAEGLVRRADVALYRAKTGGSDRVAR